MESSKHLHGPSRKGEMDNLSISKATKASPIPITNPIAKAPIERIKQNYKTALKNHQTHTSISKTISSPSQQAYLVENPPQKIVGFTISEDTIQKWREEHTKHVNIQLQAEKQDQETTQTCYIPKKYSLLEGIQERIEYMKQKQTRYKSWYSEKYS